MAQAGIYAPDVVIDADVTVKVDGVVREHASMDWSGDTTGGLPDQVVSAGAGMRSRTGSIVWAQQEEVEPEPPHPLRQTGGWPPREGDEVVIDATVDTGQGPYTFRRFTGRLGRTTGSLVDGTLRSELWDTFADRLSTMVTVPPLAWTSSVGDAPSSWTVAYRALEASGLGHLPPADRDTIIHYSGQGESTPIAGTVVSAGGVYNDHLYGMWTRDPVLLPAPSPVRGSRDVMVVARGSVRYASWAQVNLSDGSTVRMSVGLDAALTLAINGATVWTGQWADDTPVPILAFQLATTGVRVWTSRTAYSIVVPTVLSRSAAVSQASGDRVSGLSVRYLGGPTWGVSVVTAAPMQPLSWTWSSVTMEPMRATRGVENVTARAVVDSWTDATLSSLWMDEYGAPTMRSRDALINGTVSRSLRIGERVFEGSWSVGDDQIRSSVTVTGKQGALRFRRDGDYRFAIHEERTARAFDAPEDTERFITAPDEDEWGPIDTIVSRLGDTFAGHAIRNSWESAVVVLAGEEQDRWAQNNGVWFETLIERLGQRTLKINESITTMPAGSTVYLKTPSPEMNSQTVYAMRDLPMPLIRAAWVSTWADYQITGTSTGPSWAPTMEHNADWWLTPENAQAVADALSAEVTKSMPTLSSVDVLWDPTRQIGDVEDWTAVDRAGNPTWIARVLVVGYSETWDGSVPTQSVDVRVISWTDPSEGKTYADLKAAYPIYGGMSGTYQQIHDALPSAR